MRKITFLLVIIFAATSVFAQFNESKQLTLKSVNSTNQFAEKLSNSQKNTAEKEKDFTFTVNPYFWTAAIGGLVSLPNTETFDFNTSFSDAVKDLSMAFMLGGRFKYKSVSLLYDMSYLKLTPDIAIPSILSSKYKSGSAEFKEFVGDFSLGYRIPLDDKNVQVDVYGGVRVWSLDKTLNLTTIGGTTSTSTANHTWVDPIFGAGVNIDFEKNWFTYLKGDMGGFGAASEFTTLFLFGAGYRFSPNWNTSLGLKSLYIDYEKDNSRWNVWQTGLVISVGYRL